MIVSPCILRESKIFSLDQHDALNESSYGNAVCDNSKKNESDDAKHNKITRGVARTVVMCRHLNETIGFTEAHSDEWG